MYVIKLLQVQNLPYGWQKTNLSKRIDIYHLYDVLRASLTNLYSFYKTVPGYKLITIDSSCATTAVSLHLTTNKVCSRSHGFYADI